MNCGESSGRFLGQSAVSHALMGWFSAAQVLGSLLVSAVDNHFIESLEDREGRCVHIRSWNEGDLVCYQLTFDTYVDFEYVISRVGWKL